jgi:hypothetical protein
MLLSLAMAATAYGRALTWGSSQVLAGTLSLAPLTVVVWADGLGSIQPRWQLSCASARRSSRGR